MFGSIGMTELIIIFTVALIVFGPRKLPELGRSLGKSLQNSSGRQTNSSTRSTKRFRWKSESGRRHRRRPR